MKFTAHITINTPNGEYSYDLHGTSYRIKQEIENLEANHPGYTSAIFTIVPNSEEAEWTTDASGLIDTHSVTGKQRA